MTIRQILLALPLLALGWLGTLASISVLSDAAPAQVALLPRPGFLAALPSDIAVVAVSERTVTLRSERPGLARRLYKAGATLVLPAGLPGCLPLPDAMR